jgi:hypothetical protein
MNKEFLEKRIEEIAIDRTNEEYQKFVDFCNNNNFARKLKIYINDKEIPLFTFGVNYGLFNNSQNENENKNLTNYDDVYKEILDKNIKLETDNLINKINTLEYLFNSNN